MNGKQVMVGGLSLLLVGAGLGAFGSQAQAATDDASVMPDISNKQVLVG